MLDPRLAAIDDRLSGVRRILAVTGGKGGIGKSTVASTLALLLARAGRRTGLLDLDLTGPSDHILLGFETGFPEEEFGVDPALHCGIRCMTVAHFAGETPAPLRGDDVTNALLELLAIARWGELDYLVVDLPPGLGDATLDMVRLLGRAEYVVVATPARVDLPTVRKTLRFLSDLPVPLAGVIENLRRSDSPVVGELAAEFGLQLLASLPWDAALDAATGDPERLAATDCASALADCVRALEV